MDTSKVVLFGHAGVYTPSLHEGFSQDIPATFMGCFPERFRSGLIEACLKKISSIFKINGTFFSGDCKYG
jgi:hypothetical protein